MSVFGSHIQEVPLSLWFLLGWNPGRYVSRHDNHYTMAKYAGKFMLPIKLNHMKGPERTFSYLVDYYYFIFFCEQHKSDSGHFHNWS